MDGQVTLPTRDKIAFGNELSNSSSTLLSTTFTTSQTEFNDCVTGSTLTITTNGGRVSVNLACSGANSSAPNTVEMGFKIDGDSFTDRRILYVQASENNYSQNISFTVLTDNLTAASHSFCLDAKTTGGAAYVNYNNASDCQFSVMEIR